MSSGKTPRARRALLARFAERASAQFDDRNDQVCRGNGAFAKP
jgi:hypothetical protein